MTITGLAANARYGSVRIYARGEDWDRGPIYSYDGIAFTDAHDMVAAGGTTTDTSNGGLGNDANSNGQRMWISVPDFTTDGDGNFSIWFRLPDPNPDGVRSDVDSIAFDDAPEVATPGTLIYGK